MNFGKTSEQLKAILAKANPNVLRMALYQATQDADLLSMEIVSRSVRGGAYQLPELHERHRDEILRRALAFLLSKDQGPFPGIAPERLRDLMAAFAGEPVSGLVADIGRGSLATDEFSIGVEWTRDPPQEVKDSFRVAIIGAGFGGMAAAIQLRRLGIPHVVIERNSGIGGTWWLNDYPEARVDIASHHYQFSFMKKYPWKHWYATQPELKAYAEAIAEKYELADNISLNTEVKHAEWHNDRAVWSLSTRTSDGEEGRIEANFILSAAGLFNAVNLPDIRGIKDFEGGKFHSTAWNHSCEIAGKRVGLIGVGSTGAQLMPYVAREAAHLTVFQRSPQWVSPIEGYRDPIPEEVQWLFDHFPFYWAWYSFSIFFSNMGHSPEGLHEFDHEWRKAGGLTSPRNDKLREFNLAHIRSKVGDDPVLLKKVTPDYPPYAKRPVIDNGWFDALRRPNVALVTEPIERITPNGVLTGEGVEHPVDVLLLCAGFKTERYLWPVRYEGKGGRTLEEAWSIDGARAYLGMTIAGFPNLFTIYGPNGQARAGGIFMWIEMWVRYALRAVAAVIEDGHRSIEVRSDVATAYNERLDEATKALTWEEYPSYYVNEHGRQGVNMPWTPDEYWTWIQAPDLSDYEIT